MYNIYIYILKRHYKEIEKSILHKRMMVIYTYIYKPKKPLHQHLNLLMP